MELIGMKALEASGREKLINKCLFNLNLLPSPE